MKKLTIFLSILISFLFTGINSKKCRESAKCPGQFEEIIQSSPQKETSDNLKYVLPNKNVDFSRDGKKLTLKFKGVLNKSNLQSPFDELKVIYIVRFYDKAKLDIDNILAVLEIEKPLKRYGMLKLQDEISENEEWEVDIEENDEREQIVQLIAQASSKESTETFVYNSFSFKYEKGDHKREFWIIFAAMVGIILLTFCALTLYIFIKGDDARPSLKVKELNAFQNDEGRPTNTDNSATTS